MTTLNTIASSDDELKSKSWFQISLTVLPVIILIVTGLFIRVNIMHHNDSGEEVRGSIARQNQLILQNSKKHLERLLADAHSVISAFAQLDSLQRLEIFEPALGPVFTSSLFRISMIERLIVTDTGVVGSNHSLSVYESNSDSTGNLSPGAPISGRLADALGKNQKSLNQNPGARASITDIPGGPHSGGILYSIPLGNGEAGGELVSGVIPRKLLFDEMNDADQHSRMLLTSGDNILATCEYWSREDIQTVERNLARGTVVNPQSFTQGQTAHDRWASIWTELDSPSTDKLILVRHYHPLTAGWDKTHRFFLISTIAIGLVGLLTCFLIWNFRRRYIAQIRHAQERLTTIREKDTLAAISQYLVSVNKIERAFSATASLLTKKLSLPVCVIEVYLPEEDCLSTVASVGLDLPAGPGRKVPVAASPSGRVLRTAELESSDSHLATSSEASRNSWASMLESYICVAVGTATETLGTITIGDFTTRDMPESLKQSMLLVANSLAESIQRIGILAALKASEENFKDLYDSAPIAYLSINNEGIITRANKRTAEMFGHAIDSLLGSRLQCLLRTSQNNMTPSDRLVPQLLKGKTVRNQVVEMKRSDGCLIWGNLSATPITADENSPAGARVAIVDITERKKAGEERTKLASLISNSTDFVGLSTLEGQVLYLNEAARRLVGLSSQTDFRNLHISEFFDDKDAKFLAETVLPETLKDGKYRYETHLRHFESHRLIPVEFNSFLIRDRETDEPVALGATMRDLTAQKMSEAALDQLAQLPRINPNPVLTMNLVGNVLYLNPAAIDLSQKRPGQTILDYLPDSMQELIDKCAATDRAILRVKKESRGETWMWDIYPVSGEDTVHCHGKNVTEQIQREQELRKLSAAVEQSPILISMTDTKGIIEYVNPQYCLYTGYESEEVIGRNAGLLKSGKHDAEFYRNLWGTITSGQTWSGNILNKKKNGEEYWERKIIGPLFDPEGKIIGYVSNGEDITEQLKTQQKFAEKDKLSAIGTLAAGVAHEFKNYLGGIIGNASYALSELGSNDGLKTAESVLKDIIDMGDRANEIAMSLLSYSRANPREVEMQPLEKIIIKSLNLIKKELQHNAIEIVTFFEDCPEVEISSSKIQQVLINLLINAQHAVKSNGVISIALLNHSETVTVKIGDSGVGIPAEILSKIFDPFFSTKGVWGKDEVVGTGMGLSIARNIAREHGGDLSVESIQGVGTTFTLSLPKPSEIKSTVRPPTHHQPGRRILIFSLDKSIYADYFESACRVKVELVCLDNSDKLSEVLNDGLHLAVCDARFVAKIELLRAIDALVLAGVPYVMVNCGTAEYQLAAFYEKAQSNFKEIPSFNRILESSMKPAQNPAAQDA